MIKSIAIPNELKLSKNNEDMEEEGEIKDDEWMIYIKYFFGSICGSSTFHK